MLLKYYINKNINKKLILPIFFKNLFYNLKQKFNLFFKITKNNIFINCYKNNGKTLLRCSLGQLKSKNKKLVKVYFGEYLAILLKNFLLKNLNIIFLGGSVYFRKTLLLSFLRYNFTLLKINDNTKLPHNGCKLKKQLRGKRVYRVI